MADDLPPVEPPSEGFVVKLFVVPLLIVSVIVGVYLAFYWLVHLGTDPRKYVQQIEKDNALSWQAAHDLTLELQRQQGLKRDEPLAAELTKLLDRELEEGGFEQDDLRLRYFLAKTLGEFELPGPVPVLVRAARTDRDPRELAVRMGAIEALAVLSGNLRGDDRNPPALIAEQVVPELLAASRSPENELRKVAAYALGAAGGDAALERLEELLDDGFPDVRYNAATGLARHGRSSAAIVLAEMLDPEEDVALRIEEEGAREHKQALIVANALRASALLAEQAPAGSLEELRAAVERLRDAGLGLEVRVECEKVLQAMERGGMSSGTETSPL
jgi:HEAT repeat protein